MNHDQPAIQSLLREAHETIGADKAEELDRYSSYLSAVRCIRSHLDNLNSMAQDPILKAVIPESRFQFVRLVSENLLRALAESPLGREFGTPDLLDQDETSEDHS